MASKTTILLYEKIGVQAYIIGASLSEPHINELIASSVCMYVCMYIFIPRTVKYIHIEKE